MGACPVLIPTIRGNTPSPSYGFGLSKLEIEDGGRRADVITLRTDVEARGWESETARHDRVVSNIERHLRRLEIQRPVDARG